MRILIAFCTLCLLSARTNGQLQQIGVVPTFTGPAIETIHGPHIAMVDPSAKPLHRLLVMIAGTNGAARSNLIFDSLAASLGYYVISLDYKNTVITTVCSNSTNNKCFDQFRQEIIFGEPVSAEVDVDTANSILNRLYRAILVLQQQHPDQHWNEFLIDGSINWEKVVVAGHSQGAGHAAYLAQHFPVQRALIFAGPQDYLAYFNTPAGWLSGNSKTPASSYFAFLHTRDPFDFNKQLANCLVLMKKKKPNSKHVYPGKKVEDHPQILITDIETTNAHGSMLQSEFMAQWRYLLALPSANN